ncbi:MAG: hypothetical protein Q4F75_05180 [Pseudomonadota bacterium]|nr:hypothetical protein [Pseudomonadota bacterium]
MNINLKFLLLGTSLSLIPQYAAGQCAVTDCQQLGYTSLKKCDNGLKCPFGEYWACPKVEEKAVLGECTGYAKNCKIGDILNGDGTCTTNKEAGKTPIGVVVYIGGDNCGQALALKDLGAMLWATAESVDIPDFPHYESVSAAEQDFDSCGNTQKIIKQGTSTYPAAWAAVNYAPSSVPATKGKWCLPAAGVARSMMNNYSAIISGLSKAGGELLPGMSVHNHWYWSSSEIDIATVWGWCYACARLDRYGKVYGTTGYVRPVIAF